jgi:hypothetical protein
MNVSRLLEVTMQPYKKEQNLTNKIGCWDNCVNSTGTVQSTVPEPT